MTGTEQVTDLDFLAAVKVPREQPAAADQAVVGLVDGGPEAEVRAALRGEPQLREPLEQLGFPRVGFVDDCAGDDVADALDRQWGAVADVAHDVAVGHDRLQRH